MTKQNSKKATKPAAKAVKVAAKKEAKPSLTLERSNRTNPNSKSVRGDRKVIYVGVTETKANEVTATDPKKAATFSLDVANKIMAKALEHKNVVKARLHPRKEGQRSVWIAYAKDNPGLGVARA